MPVVAIVEQHTRQDWEILRYRINLVTDRSRNIYRLKALLDKLGYDSNGNFTTYKRLNNIVIEKLPLIYASIVINYIERIMDLTKKLFNTKKEI